MRNVVLLISLAVNLLPNIEALSHGENLLARLNDEIHRVNALIAEIEEHYRDRMHTHPGQSLPRNYEGTLRRAGTSIDAVLRLMRTIEEGNSPVKDGSVGRRSSRNMRNMNTRRSDGLDWKANFYKALSRALKNEFQDEPIIQENIHDGFVPPTWLKKPSRQ